MGKDCHVFKALDSETDIEPLKMATMPRSRLISLHPRDQDEFESLQALNEVVQQTYELTLLPANDITLS